MNISRIRQMTAEGDMSVAALRYLLDCHGECEHLDFKSSLELASDHESASIAKDVIGMKNVGGGYIIIGVEDKSWKPIGIEERLNYDTKILRDRIRKCSGLDIEVDIVQHDIYLNGKTSLFAIILVRSSKKRSKLKVPSIIKNNFQPAEKWGIRLGEIYARFGDVTRKVETDTELQELLDNLESQYQEQDLETANTIPSPFAVDKGLYRLLPREYGTFIGREQFKLDLRKAIQGDPRIWIINLHGPGGVGKSALATWMAYEYYNDQRPFEAILHLSAKDIELSTEDGIKHLNPTLISLEDFLDRVLHLFEHGEYCNKGLDERKSIVTEILSAYQTLLILDNMETVNDGRIMEFIRSLPPISKTKVLLTSRRRTSDWEYPIQVTELDEKEIREFVSIRNTEMKLDLPTQDIKLINRLKIISGGLPLAIQWMLGEYAKTKDLDAILSRSLSPDSPLLEFSFRNSWNVLNEDEKQALAVLSIFETHPTAQEWCIAIDWPIEKLDKAINSLVEVTFVTERIEEKTGKKIYYALPITLSFARNELAKFIGLEAQAQLRLQSYRNKMNLASIETSQYSDFFNKFEAHTDVQKKALILSRMAEGQTRSLGYQSANQYYKQALEVDPRSVYALVSYGLFKIEVGNIGEAIDLIEQATKYSTKKTGYYVYFSLSRVYDQRHDRINRIRCLRKALEYEPKHSIARHSLGVALSQNGNYDEALRIFDEIIREECQKDNPTETLVYAFKTKVITLKRARREVEAKRTLQEAINKINKFENLKYLVKSLHDMTE